MARDWSKQRRRQQVRLAYDQEAEIARALAEYTPPTKEEERAAAAEAVREFFAAGGKVKRLPTVLHLRCPSCKHRGKARVPHGKSWPRFRCSRCGSRI